MEKMTTSFVIIISKINMFVQVTKKIFLYLSVLQHICYISFPRYVFPSQIYQTSSLFCYKRKLTGLKENKPKLPACDMTKLCLLTSRFVVLGR